MKHKRTLLCIVIALLLLLCLSVWKNVDDASQEKQKNKWLLTEAYPALLNISEDLGFVLNKAAELPGSHEACALRLNTAANQFAQLQVLFRVYQEQVPVGYSGLPFSSFEQFSFLLTYTSVTVDGRDYNGILTDDSISEGEIQYLTRLKNDVDFLILEMTSDEGSFHDEIMTHELQFALRSFFEVWTSHNRNRDNPLYLL